MEKTIRTDPSVGSLMYGYVDYGENITDSCFVSPELKAVAAVCMAISLCGLVGNGLVLWFLGCHVKQNPSATYILYLAIADFLLLLLILLLLLADLNFSSFCLHDLIPLYIKFVQVVTTLCQYFELSSLAFLTALCVEQCLAVLFPAWYSHHCPKHYSVIVCLVLVALAGLYFYPSHIRPLATRSYERAVAIATCTIILPLLVVSNLALFIKLRCGSQRSHPGNIHVPLLLSMTFFFDLGIFFPIHVFLYLPHSDTFFPGTASLIFLLLDSVNSSINPVLYFLVGSWQQRCLQCSPKAAFQRLFEEEASSEERRQEPGDAVMETSV